MNLQNRSLTMQDNSFETLLDYTCVRLQDTQTQYSIRRLREFDLILEDMERELGILVCLQDTY